MYQVTTPANDFQQDRTLKSKNKPSNCPWCGSHRIAIVLGGMPVYIPELENELADGDRTVGDPPDTHTDPAWQCTECGAQFFRDLHLVNNRD